MMMKTVRLSTLSRSFSGVLLAVACAAQSVTGLEVHAADSLPEDLPELRWHLTARPWQPINAPEREFLDQLDKAIHAMVSMQYWSETNAADVKNGAIIDPFDHKELQYATPLFAFNAATLLTRDRASDLVLHAARAMDRCTLDISDGPANDWHGEFFCAAMVKTIRILEPLQARYPEILTSGRIQTWKQRMKSRRNAFMNMKVKQNWRTFAMKGEWLRQRDGYISDGVTWNEACWLSPQEGAQRERFRRDHDKYGLQPHFFMYHDDTAEPETFAYNGATTANLLDMLEAGYDGSSANEMREIIARNLRASLLMMSASGEAPAGGRTGDHTWNDSIYANAFALMSEAAQREGDLRLAGQYWRATQLLLRSHARFQQQNGWFSITKNAFPPELKNRYATWSGVGNYLGFTLSACSEVVLARKSQIVEQPAPAEIGGYAMTLDPEFQNVFINAGGMQAQICTRGESDNYGGVQWHVLGITRFSRIGWDGRMGPGSAHVTTNFNAGYSFAPAFLENGKWKLVSTEPRRFVGRFKPDFVHPLLVRGAYTIAPVGTNTGPAFRMNITLTPDGALVDTSRTEGTNDFAVIWPLLEFDGRTVLQTNIGTSIASTAFPANESSAPKDQQNFIALKKTHQIDSSAGVVRGGYGDFRPVRVSDSKAGAVETFVYPRNDSDPSAERVRASFRRKGSDFTSVLGKVVGNVYIGRTAAGGLARQIDANGDGYTDVAFDKECAFIVQLQNGRITAIETDRDVTARVGTAKYTLSSFKPRKITR